MAKMHKHRHSSRPRLPAGCRTLPRPPHLLSVAVSVKARHRFAPNRIARSMNCQITTSLLSGSNILMRLVAPWFRDVRFTKNQCHTISQLLRQIRSQPRIHKNLARRILAGIRGSGQALPILRAARKPHRPPRRIQPCLHSGEISGFASPSAGRFSAPAVLFCRERNPSRTSRCNAVHQPGGRSQ